MRGIRRLVMSAAVAAAMLAVGSTGPAVPAHGPTADAPTRLASISRPASVAPRFVTGYSLHCSEEMGDDNVTGAEVDHVVENYYLRATYDEGRDTWRYPGPTLIVVLNPNGYCVTVFRP